MLTAQIPLLLALVGTALMAVVIFAPSPATATVSFAPPAAPAVERWSAPVEDWSAPPTELWNAPAHHRDAPAPGMQSTPLDENVAPRPAWPALVDPCAAGCDAASRLALVEALAAVRGPWADAILRRAHGDESDASVAAAIVSALGG